MTDAPPIPPAIWQRLLAFLREEKTGDVTFRVQRGVVKRVRIEEEIRADEERDRRGTVLHSR